jgi:hypothetical protein
LFHPFLAQLFLQSIYDDFDTAAYSLGHGFSIRKSTLTVIRPWLAPLKFFFININERFISTNLQS